MATWNFSGYRNGRGASVTFTYTTAYDTKTNKTTVTITNYTSVFNTGGASGFCFLTGTLTVKATDNTSSSGTMSVYQDKTANSPTVSKDVSQSIIVSHGTGTSKQVTLSFNGTIGAATYETTLTDADTYTVVTVANATSRTLSISADTGANVTVYRQSSPWASTGNLTGGTVYDGDVLKISFSVGDSYNLENHTVNGETFTSGDTHAVSGDVAVVATATVKSYLLSVSTLGGAIVDVTRTSSPKQGASIGTVINDDTVYYSDVLVITFTAPDGYKIATHTVNGSMFPSGNSHTVTGAVSVVASAIEEEVSPFSLYTLFVADGEAWVLANQNITDN